MSTVLDSPDAITDRTAFNRAVWAKLLADPALARLDYRIETDQHGQIIMSPPPAPSHGSKQSAIAAKLHGWNEDGRVITECPISTAKGVKAADVAWCSTALWEEAKEDVCFARSPEICVEVLSPSNSTSEISEKKALYFQGGAREVWICGHDGRMAFYLCEDPESEMGLSGLVPDFATQID